MLKTDIFSSPQPFLTARNYEYPKASQPCPPHPLPPIHQNLVCLALSLTVLYLQNGLQQGHATDIDRGK